ncbi:hypothetical protein NDU88_003926 [Pleurodeles waltl]|uniref:Uncharacterized protein n=1 Tax=Pleurodeles waltl TaxID=8319 RepID=A0AAV7QB34_PLEWA|nr:hypothetical protein NDU88_003926 [Pleurodeles waltl]
MLNNTFSDCGAAHSADPEKEYPGGTAGSSNADPEESGRRYGRNRFPQEVRRERRKPKWMKEYRHRVPQENAVEETSRAAPEQCGKKMTGRKGEVDRLATFWEERGPVRFGFLQASTGFLHVDPKLSQMQGFSCCFCSISGEKRTMRVAQQTSRGAVRVELSSPDPSYSRWRLLWGSWTTR